MSETIAPPAPPFWRDVLSAEERRELLEVSALRGWIAILSNWFGVFAALALVAWAPSPLTIVLALVILGTRQLGMAVIMHEAAHRTLLPSRAMNDWAGNWLGAYPVWADVQPYRAYHLVHHARTGTADDPDLGLVTPFPITPASFRRKIWRDLSGQTGWKQAKAVFKRDMGRSSKATQRDLSMSRGERPDVGWHKLVPVATTNLALLGVLAAFGHAELYLLWVIAWFTTYRLVTRLRSIAEHAMAPDLLDPMQNTRTTIASWWERLLVAPNRVNFHLEHHLLMTVPHYKLPRLHRMLRERGALEGANVSHGYWGVYRHATSAPVKSGALLNSSSAG